MQVIKKLLMLGSMALVSGCAQPTAPTDQTVRIKDLQEQVQGLSNDLVSMLHDKDQLEQRINSLELAEEFNTHATVYLDPAERAFGRLDADVGTFAVSIEDVRPFADGVRVKVTLGNLTQAKFDGATLKLKYGPRPPHYAAGDKEFHSRWQAWKDALHEKTENLTASLVPGHWNPVEIVLPGTEPKDFGHLEVSMTTNQIILFR